MSMLWIENVGAEFGTVHRIAESRGLEVDEALDVEGAMARLLKQPPPDVILLDLYVPLGAAQELRSQILQQLNTKMNEPDLAARVQHLLSLPEIGLVVPLLFPSLRRRTIVLSVVTSPPKALKDIATGINKWFSKRTFGLHIQQFEAAIDSILEGNSSAE